MKSTDIIKKAILSEKAYKQMEMGIYTFLVDPASTKQDVKTKVENQFKVLVDRVNLASKPFKMKRIARTRKQAKTGGGKKAIVWLKSGQSITMLLPKTKEQKPKAKSKEKDVQKVSVEGKEG